MGVLRGVKDRIDVKVTAELEVDNNKVDNQTFVVTYKKPTTEEVKELESRLLGERDPDEPGEYLVDPVTDEELAEEMILDWKGVPTTDGSEFEFNSENLSEMLSSREYRDALAYGLRQVIFGRESVMAKNSLGRGKRGR